MLHNIEEIAERRVTMSIFTFVLSILSARNDSHVVGISKKLGSKRRYEYDETLGGYYLERRHGRAPEKEYPPFPRGNLVVESVSSRICVI